MICLVVLFLVILIITDADFEFDQAVQQPLPLDGMLDPLASLIKKAVGSEEDDRPCCI